MGRARGWGMVVVALGTSALGNSCRSGSPPSSPAGLGDPAGARAPSPGAVSADAARCAGCARGVLARSGAGRARPPLAPARGAARDDGLAAHLERHCARTLALRDTGDVRRRYAELIAEAPRGCAWLDHLTDDALSPRGRRADGAACSTGLQCRSGACSLTLAGCGACVPADQPLGAPCGGGQSASPLLHECARGLYCRPQEPRGGRVERGTCAALPAEGAACEQGFLCAEGLRCDAGSRCVARGRSGEPCAASSACRDGLWCVAGRCASEVPGLGAACTDLCQGGALCVDGRCRERGAHAAGERCEDLFARCVPGHACRPDAARRALTCQPVRPVREACESALHCGSLVCAEGRCAVGTQGGACTFPTDCEGGECTPHGACTPTPRASEGAACASSEACRAGLYCVRGRCEPPADVGAPCVALPHGLTDGLVAALWRLDLPPLPRLELPAGVLAERPCEAPYAACVQGRCMDRAQECR